MTSAVKLPPTTSPRPTTSRSTGIDGPEVPNGPSRSIDDGPSAPGRDRVSTVSAWDALAAAAPGLQRSGCETRRPSSVPESALDTGPPRRFRLFQALDDRPVPEDALAAQGAGGDGASARAPDPQRSVQAGNGVGRSWYRVRGSAFDALSSGALQVAEPTARPRTVLAIEPGGVRGIIPATVLSWIEQVTGKPTAELFDVITGSSTGGILALGLTKPKEGRAEYSAADLAGFYESDCASIFPNPTLNRIRTGYGVLGTLYPSSGIDGVLRRYFQDAPMSSALTRIVIPAFEYERYRQWYFRNGDDLLMREVARATSAAPTYLEPAQVLRNGKSYTFIDGAMLDNAPASTGLREARRLFGAREPLLLVSLATGISPSPSRFDDVRKWGLVKWASQVPGLIMDANGMRRDHDLREELPTGLYYRYQTDIVAGHKAFDDWSEDNMAYLKDQARALIEDNEDSLRELAKKLTVGDPCD